MKTVKLHGQKARGRVALVDDDDYALVSRYRWHVHETWHPRRGTTGPYAATSLRREGKARFIHMHTLITGWPRTDHANGDGLDNQRRNLRPATVAQNNHNQRPQAGHSSRFKGVTWHKKGRKWQAAIKVNGKNRYLGLFVREEDAADAYAAAALEIQGEYAYAARESRTGNAPEVRQGAFSPDRLNEVMARQQRAAADQGTLWEVA